MNMIPGLKETGPGRVRRGFTLSFWALSLLGLLAGACAQGTEPEATEPEATETTAPAAEAERQPKNLEATVTIVMGEALPEMYFASPEGERGGLFTVRAGETVGIKVINAGDLEHEIAFGREFDPSIEFYRTNLFEDLSVDFFVFKPVKTEVEGATFEEIEVEPGGEFWIRTVFPAELAGEWEISCFVEGHYDAGMKATLIIEE